jgi:hypothetical protein
VYDYCALGKLFLRVPVYFTDMTWNYPVFTGHRSRVDPELFLLGLTVIKPLT